MLDPGPASIHGRAAPSAADLTTSKDEPGICQKEREKGRAGSRLLGETVRAGLGANPQPHFVPLACPAGALSLLETSGFAQHLMKAATALVPQFEAGKPIDATILRAAV